MVPLNATQGKNGFHDEISLKNRACSICTLFWTFAMHIGILKALKSSTSRKHLYCSETPSVSPWSSCLSSFSAFLRVGGPMNTFFENIALQKGFILNKYIHTNIYFS
jgi:hypothetical protein